MSRVTISNYIPLSFRTIPYTALPNRKAGCSCKPILTVRMPGAAEGNDG